MLTITRKHLTNPTSRPALRDDRQYAIIEMRGLVMHWTANTSRGADALANRNYFNIGSRFASAHYVVDDHSAVQCIPDNEVAYHVGAKTYMSAGNAIRSGSRLTPNHFTIGVEMCVNSDGDWQKTYQNSVDLAAFLFLKHRLKSGCLYRHFDITGKDCPRMMLTPDAWQAFINDMSLSMLNLEKRVRYHGKTRVEGLNVRSGPGMEHSVVGSLYLNEPCLVLDVSGNWAMIEENGWVYASFIQAT